MTPDPSATRDLLWSFLEAQAAPDPRAWLLDRAAAFRDSDLDRTLYLTFSAVPRYFSKRPLQLSQAQVEAAAARRTGFQPGRWSIDRTARVWLLLQIPGAPQTAFARRVSMLFEHADMREAEALYSSLPLLPHPGSFIDRTTEGIRTNMTLVFDAIALDNPYPADHLPEDAWNQMVLKAAFLDRPLYRIYGLERRANAKLAAIISDYAHERWAAGRVVSPELWRPVSPFLNEVLLEDLQKLFAADDPRQHEAAALVCSHSEHPEARALLAGHPELVAALESGALHWDSLARRWWDAKAAAAS